MGRNCAVQLFGTKGQKFLCCPGAKGQRDKLKILPRAGTGRDSQSKPGTGQGFDILPRDGTRYWQPVPDNLGTTTGQKGEKKMKKIEKKKIEFLFLFLFLFFFKFWALLDIFCPGTSQDRGVCPRIFAPTLVWDKGTPGQVFFCPWTCRPLEALASTSYAKETTVAKSLLY